ncbi:hypothetical protein LWI28_013317 [Acer negundo]|uniref:RNase H type-1 domain-containing protein n=1 Tax=Acer negundo TaxID=4023 RepID=A0AAD5NFJ8_ACENE|nr:hypothetical protein LWI28_013317 [Acer negundo]
MNCATAFDRQMENTGIGVLVKDSEGEVLGCCSQTLETILSMNVAHHLTIQKGIQFGVDYGFLLNVFEMDDAKVIDWINNGSHSDSEFGAILMEITSLTEATHGQLFRNTSKSANKATQVLSNYALGLTHDEFWLEDFPICIDRVIASEKPGYALCFPCFLFYQKKKKKYKYSA